MLELDYDAQPLSEYALMAWTRLTEQGLPPVDTLSLIEAQLRCQRSRPPRESAQALRLIGKWREMVGNARARLH